MKIYLSVIIPAFNEERRIKTTLASVTEYLRSQRYSYEIIVVDDGSTDGTASLVKKLADTIPHLKLLQLPRNKGKGSAVKTGMLTAQGALRLFMDADGSTNISELEKLLPFVQEHYDVIIGSRRIKGALVKVRQHLLRDTLGWIFRRLVRILIPINVADTQNGFKLFTKKAAEEIFSRTKITGWTFDIEALLLAKELGFKTKEVPIVWVNDENSRVRYHHTVSMFFDLLSLRARYIKNMN